MCCWSCRSRSASKAGLFWIARVSKLRGCDTEALRLLRERYGDAVVLIERLDGRTLGGVFLVGGDRAKPRPDASSDNVKERRWVRIGWDLQEDGMGFCIYES